MQFLSPWFLLGALTVGIPIWLHLIRREQAVRIPFSSLMFLRRIPIKSFSRQRLKYLLLLATRVLVILLIALAFARPYFPGTQQYLTATGGEKHAVILLDASMSMQYGERWQRALAAAREEIAGLSDKDVAQIGVFSSDFEIQNQPTSDKGELQAVLDSNPSPTASPTSYAQAFRAVERIAEDSGRPLSVVLITDVQKSGLGSPPQALAMTAAAAFRVVDVGDAESPNWTVEGVRSRRTIYRSRYPERLRVHLRGFNSPEATREVILTLAGKVVQRKSVTVPAGGSAVVEFEGFDVPRGSNQGEVRIAPADGLPADDSFHFILERREPYRLLFLRESGNEIELYYFRNALAAEADSPFLVEARTPSEAASLPLREYAMVVLSNVSSLPPSLAGELPGYVKAGGGLFVSAGNRFPAPGLENQFQEFWPAKGIERRVLTRDEDRLVLLGEFDRKHPVFREFSESGMESLRAVEVYAYVRVQPQGPVSLRLANGEPVLIEKPYGRGRVLLFASSFDNVWSDFPLHPAFVPLVHQLVRYTMQLPEEPAAYKIPGAVSLATYKAPGAEEATGGVWDVMGPDGKREVPLAEERRPDFLVLRRPGFYEIRHNRDTHWVASNPDPQESDLSRLSEEDRAVWMGGGRNQQAAESAGGAELEKRQTLWWNLLVIALLLALAEVYLANQYLRPRGSATASQTAEESSYVTP